MQPRVAMCWDHYVRRKHSLIMRHAQVGALIVLFVQTSPARPAEFHSNPY